MAWESTRSPCGKDLRVPHLALLAAIHLWIAWDLFFVPFTGYGHAMHGFWISLARWQGNWWSQPHWWPYHDAGMPFEYTYAPLVPLLVRGLHGLGVPHGHGLQIVSAATYCLLPLSAYGALVRLTGERWWSLGGVLAFSLAGWSALVVPDAAFTWDLFRTARLLYLQMVWDETPHVLSLALVLAGVGRGWVGMMLASAFALLASAFGASLLLLVAGCQWLAGEGPRQTGAAGWAYLGVCFALPPSLWMTVARNTRLNGETAPYAVWILAAGAVALSTLAVGLHKGPWNAGQRFFVLVALAVLVPPVLATYAGVHVIPQPNRYKVEIDVFLPLGLLLFLRPWVGVPWVAPLLLLAIPQALLHQREATVYGRRLQPEQMVEARLSGWIDAHLPGQRVCLPGSFGFWHGAFSRVPQLGGASYPTALNPVQQQALMEVVLERGDSLRWLRIFGASAVAVADAGSEEFWKPFEKPAKFAGLPVLWEEPGSRLYAVSGAAPTGEWEGPNRFRAPGGEVAVNWHSGWRSAGGQVRQSPNGLLETPPGLVEYGGDAEWWLTRAVSAAAWLGLAVAGWVTREGRAGPGKRL